MSIKPIEKAAFCLYDLGWKLAIPVLRLNHRLAEGFEQRSFQRKAARKADLWIQAASAGESYLTWDLIKNLKPPYPIKVLVTSNTSQGISILKRAIKDIAPNNRGVEIFTAYFPFDRPAIMANAIRAILPTVMVLLETEIWPGLLATLKKFSCKTVVLNGRITPKSLSRYLIWPSIWKSIRPDKIFAISQGDADRFATLFGKNRIGVMQNMKFDRFDYKGPSSFTKNPLEKIVQPSASFVVFGSVRREEEPLIEKIICDIRGRYPIIITGLFPRHMQRIPHWKKTLERLSIPWVLRSETIRPVAPGTVILWDTFGELPLAYGLSKAAFVGGSLVPLGGQNFLEALTSGVLPIIGPYWENFAWVGSDIVSQELIRIASDWQEVADLLVEDFKKTPSHGKVRERALNYIKSRQGGTAHACRVIEEYLNSSEDDSRRMT